MRATLKKRVFSVFLAVVLVFCLMPLTALAVPTIITASLPDGMVGTVYNTTLGASGEGALAWTVTNGSLPSGLSLGASSGTIAGTPTVEGTSTFVVKASDRTGDSAPKSFVLRVLPVAVTSVTMNKTSTTLAVGAEETLTATILPSSATAAVVWATSNPGVATVTNGRIKAVAPGTANITATAGGITATCAVTVANNVLRGTAYLYGAGGRTTLGGASIYGNTNTGYYFSAITDATGNYSVNIPVGQNFSSIRITASSNFILGRLRLNKAETAIENGYRTVTAEEATGNVDFYFVDPPKVSGRVLSTIDGPIKDAYVSVWDSVRTDVNGRFTAQSYISNIGSQSAYVSINATNHYAYSVNKSFNISVDTLKAGLPLDIGDITLTKFNQGGPFGNSSKNNLSLMPSTVASGETSNATVNVNASQPMVAAGAQIKVAVDNDAVIRAERDNLVRVTANGQEVPKSKYNRVLSGNELTITIDLQPHTQYQITFGIQAPKGLQATGYTAQATVNGTLIGKQVATIHNLTVNAPAEISMSDKFNVYGEVASNNDVRLALHFTSPIGKDYTFKGEVVHNGGYFYKFEDIQIPANIPEDYPFGEYTVTVKMYSKQEGNLISEASTKMIISEKPVSIKSMLLRDDFNTVSLENPVPGNFLTFVGWVDGNLQSMDYRRLKAEVKLNNASEVSGVRFLMQTTHGKYNWNATQSGDTFSAYLRSYRGTGKASVSMEITKKDGSIATYSIGNLVILIDPSGHVYDTKTGARIGGAKATLYYDQGNGWVLWPADEFMQINPQYTDSEGKYGWMVPEGKYKVVVSKEGYTSFDTFETPGSPYKDLNVLPEQKDINIGLTPLGGGYVPSGPTDTGSGSGSGGSGGDIVQKSTASPATTWMSEGNSKSATRATGPYGIRASAWGKLGTKPYTHETLSSNVAQVKVSIINPSLFKKDTLVSGYVSGNQVQSIEKIFSKWYKNKTKALCFDQQGDWAAPVQVTAKVNLAGLDTKKLCFYSYDIKLNNYRRIPEPNYQIDKNGNLTFTTPYAGAIVISENPLKA